MSNYEQQSKIPQIIEFLDIGGVYPQFTVRGTNQMYKTYRGGIVSLILYLASIGYFTYIIELWRRGGIIPKTETQTTILNYQEFSFEYNPIDFFFLNSNLSSLNPFDPKRKIIVPIVQHIHFTNFSGFDIIRSNLTYTEQGFYGPLHVNDSKLTQNLSLIHNQKKVRENQSDEKEESQILVSFIKCNPKFISQQEKCASQSEIDEFFKQPLNQIHLTINLRQYLKKQLEIQEQPKTFYFLLDPVNVGYTQVVLRTKMTNVNDGLIFQREYSETYVSEAQVTMQSIDPLYLEQDKSFQGMEFFFLFLIRLDSIQDQETISYVTLGEILAQIGSIINVLFSIKPLLHYINRRELQGKLLSHICSITHENQTKNPLEVVEKTNIFNVYQMLLKLQQDVRQTRDHSQADLRKPPENLQNMIEYQIPQIENEQSDSEPMIYDAKWHPSIRLTPNCDKDPPLNRKNIKMNKESLGANIQPFDIQFLYKSFEA